MTSIDKIENTAKLDFALTWLPYGGGTTEDIMVTFGLTPSAFYRRVAAILDSPDDTDPTLHPRLRDALKDLCTRRTPSTVGL